MSVIVTLNKRREMSSLVQVLVIARFSMVTALKGSNSRLTHSWRHFKIVSDFSEAANLKTKRAKRNVQFHFTKVLLNSCSWRTTKQNDS